MYKNQRRIKELTPYIPAVDIFRIYEREPGAAFLDSSLVNELGHYSVIGRCPYLKLVKEVTVDFDKVGVKKMFAGFAKLKKL